MSAVSEVMQSKLVVQGLPPFGDMASKSNFAHADR